MDLAENAYLLTKTASFLWAYMGIQLDTKFIFPFSDLLDYEHILSDGLWAQYELRSHMLKMPGPSAGKPLGVPDLLPTGKSPVNSDVHDGLQKSEK